MEPGAESVGVVLAVEAPRLLGVCCHEVWRETEGCAVCSERLLRGADVESGRWMLDPA